MCLASFTCWGNVAKCVAAVSSGWRHGHRYFAVRCGQSKSFARLLHYKPGCAICNSHRQLSYVPSLVLYPFVTSLGALHFLTGSWFSATGLYPLTFQILFVFPTRIFLEHSSRRLKACNHEINLTAKQLQNEVIREGSKRNWTVRETQKELALRLKRKRQELYAKHNCHPGRFAALSVINGSVWLLSSIAISVCFPGCSVFSSSLLNYSVPIFAGIASLAKRELLALKGFELTQFKFIALAHRAGAVALPVAAFVLRLPGSVVFFWIAWNMSIIVIDFLLMHPFVRKLCYLEMPLGEYKPYRSLAENARKRYLRSRRS